MTDTEPLTRAFNIEVGGNFNNETREMLQRLIVIETCMAEMLPNERSATLAYINARYGAA